jgi:hypothetical protein
LSAFYLNGRPEINNCSFENFHGNSSTSSCIDIYHSTYTFIFLDCSFRNITNFHPNGVGAVCLNFDGNAGFAMVGNQFIDIASTYSAVYIYSNCSYLAFEENSFVNITVLQNGSFFFFFFFLDVFRELVAIIITPLQYMNL